MTTAAFPRRFVPTEFDPANWDDARPLYEELRDRPIGSTEALHRWLLDFSELMSVVNEYGSRRYIDKSCHTDDPAIERAYLQFVEEIEPKVKPLYFELQKKSMPELDIFTQAELQWGALQTAVLGMFYAHPERADRIEFSGDLNNFVSAHKYRVYSPTDELLALIVNAMLPGQATCKECRSTC